MTTHTSDYDGEPEWLRGPAVEIPIDGAEGARMTCRPVKVRVVTWPGTEPLVEVDADPINDYLGLYTPNEARTLAVALLHAADEAGRLAQ